VEIIIFRFFRWSTVNSAFESRGKFSMNFFRQKIYKCYSIHQIRTFFMQKIKLKNLTP
jgi:hypothetical protein